MPLTQQLTAIDAANKSTGELLRLLVNELREQRLEDERFRHEAMSELLRIGDKVRRLTQDVDDSWWRGETDEDESSA